METDTVWSHLSVCAWYFHSVGTPDASTARRASWRYWIQIFAGKISKKGDNVLCMQFCYEQGILLYHEMPEVDEESPLFLVVFGWVDG